MEIEKKKESMHYSLLELFWVWHFAVQGSANYSKKPTIWKLNWAFGITWMGIEDALSAHPASQTIMIKLSDKLIAWMSNESRTKINWKKVQVFNSPRQLSFALLAS
jgi:hypothetical protein